MEVGHERSGQFWERRSIGAWARTRPQGNVSVATYGQGGWIGLGFATVSTTRAYAAPAEVRAMDDSAADQSADVRTWSVRITRAARTRGGQAVAVLIKRAAPLAALAGRLDLVEGWLRHVPAYVIDGDADLHYWSGASILLARPSDAHPHLLRAFELNRSPPVGTSTLLSWAALMDAIFLMYRDLRELDPLLDWMTLERERSVDRLPQPLRCLIVSSALFALAFRQPTHPRMAAWRDRAERLVEMNPISDLGARLTAGLIIDYTWRGNLAAAAIVAKRFEARASRTTLSPMPAVLRHVNRATLALHQGNLSDCIDAAHTGLATAAREGVRLWDGVLYCHLVAASLSRSDVKAAAEHLAALEQLFADGVPIDEAYYRAMLAQHGFIAGDNIGAMSRCQSALEVTDAKGVPYFMAVCRVSNGLTLYEAGHRDLGRALIKDGIARGKTLDNPLVAWIGGLFQAHMDYASGDTEGGDATLHAALLLGRDHSLAHFFCWPRRIIARLIDKALLRDFAPDYLKHLIAVHAFAPPSEPTRSDQWAFAARIYTFGDPRTVFADGSVEPMSAQFQRQVELLAVLIGKAHKPVPLHSAAAEIYRDEDVDAVASLKRVLHSLRERVGPIILQRQAALSLDFQKVWIDACSFQQVRQEVGDASELAWLDRHYHGHFMERIAGSRVVDDLRRRFRDQAGRAIRDALDASVRAQDEGAVRRLEGRWQPLFPQIFGALGR